MAIPAHDRLPRLGILGHGRAGKDTMADRLVATTPLRYGGSTSLHLLPYFVAWKHGVPLADVQAGRHRALCDREYARRHDARREWFDLANAIRGDDPGAFVRPALAGGELLVGVRDYREVDYARAHDLVDAFVWVHNDRVPVDPTVAGFDGRRGLSRDDCDLVIENNATLAAFHARIAALCRLCRVPLSTAT